MPTLSQVRTAIRQFGVLHSVAEANRLLTEIGGVDSLADLDPSRYSTVIAATGMNSNHPSTKLDTAAVYEKYNRPRRPIGAVKDDGDGAPAASAKPVIDEAFAKRAFDRFNNPPKRERDGDGRPLPNGGDHDDT